MKKRIRLSERDLHRVVNESVRGILNEYYSDDYLQGVLEALKKSNNFLNGAAKKLWQSIRPENTEMRDKVLKDGQFEDARNLHRAIVDYLTKYNQSQNLESNPPYGYQHEDGHFEW